MVLKVRSFQIRDGDMAEEDEAAVSAFLRAVKVDRIESAYASGGWRLLILFSDLKDKEESAQIASVIASDLRRWRAEQAVKAGVAPAEILTEDAIIQLAQYVPTTPLELRLTMGLPGGQIAPYESEIVQIIRQTLDELS